MFSSHLRWGLQSSFCPSGFFHQNLQAPLLSPIRATLPTHLILLVPITEKYWDSTGLFKMIVGVLTTCHKQYTRDRSMCIFYLIEQHSKILLPTLQVLFENF